MTTEHLDIEPIKSRSYTMEQVDGALLALCVNGGNTVQTSRTLKERGLEIPEATLRDWKLYAYPKRYAAIHNRHFIQLEDVLVQNERELAVAASRAALSAVQKAQEQLDAGKAQDPARTAQALATTGAIATDKLLTLTGRPAQITENRDAGQLLKSLGTRFRGLVIDGEAVEVTPRPETTLGQLSAVSAKSNAHE